MRWAVADDLPKIEATLQAHADWTLFPAANLARDGFNGTAPRSMRFLIGTNYFLPVSVEGMMFPLPGVPPEGLRRVLQDQTIIGAVGQSDSVTATLAAIGAGDVPTFALDDEPLMTLALDDLVVPDGPGEVRPVDESNREIATRWRRDFRVALIGEDNGLAMTRAQQDIATWVADDCARLLHDGTKALSMTALSAVAGDRVLIGGVFTPPEFRGQGLARRIVALHLAEARATHVRRAVLSAGSDAARRAYAAIGFREVDRARMTLLRTPFKVRP